MRGAGRGARGGELRERWYCTWNRRWLKATVGGVRLRLRSGLPTYVCKVLVASSHLRIVSIVAFCVCGLGGEREREREESAALRFSLRLARSYLWV